MKADLCHHEGLMKPPKSEKIKKYIRIYKQDPKSKVFAFLADHYRKKGEIDTAFQLCKKGVRANPEFALGHIALALILMDMDKLELAFESLKEACLLAPENLFAWKRLGEVCLQLKRPDKILEAYKMVLFLDPENKKAQNIVKKLEPMTATKYDDTGFSFKKIQEIAGHINSQNPKPKEVEPPVLHPRLKTLDKKETVKFESRCAMIEALIYKKEFHRAQKFLSEMKNIYYHDKNQLKNIQLLIDKLPKDISTPRDSYKQKKIQKLRLLLERIEELQP